MIKNSKITFFIWMISIMIWIIFLFSKENSIILNFLLKGKNNIKTNNIQLTQEIKIVEKNTNTQESIKIANTNQEITKETENEIIKENEYIKNNQEKTYIIPEEYDIKNMDFFSQAPYWNRNQPYQDACEEASLLIWQYYIRWFKKTKTEYNQDLLDMVELEMEMLWYFESTTIMEMKQIINRRDPSINARIIEHPSIKDIEREISKNNVVVAPFYWKWLKNPHYALWWPEYHFLVIKWYTKDHFITHDVWTMHWENRYYDKNLIMDNIHDRNRTDVQKWAARVLILEK